MTVRLPKTLFQRPQLHATIEIEDSKVSPARIDATVANNIAEAIKQSLGIDVKIAVGGVGVIEGVVGNSPEE